MTDFTRLIETEGFPLRDAGFASNEGGGAAKGTLRVLHRYPARRPLGACRAAIICSLLPDPGNKEERLLMKKAIGSFLSKDIGKNSHLLKARELIEQKLHGRSVNILDPFAGGGSIPYEALRLGCNVSSSDLNPVSWFVQMATMHYPSAIGIDEFPLPPFMAADDTYVEQLQRKSSKITESQWGDERVKTTFPFADHLKLWASWLTIQCDERLRPMYHASNGAIPSASIWCRTYTCSGCRGTVPILNSSILHKRSGKPIAAVEPEINKKSKTILWKVLCQNSGDDLSGHQQAAFKKSSKVTCPFCNHISTTKDIQRIGKDEGLGHQLIALVETLNGEKRYRSVNAEDKKVLQQVEDGAFLKNHGKYNEVFDQPLPPEGALGMRIRLYGSKNWKDVFNPRQYLAVNILIEQVRLATEQMRKHNYPNEWVEALTIYLTCITNLVTERNTVISKWNPPDGSIKPTFETYALPMRWTYAESYPASNASGSLQKFTDTIVPIVNSILQSCAFTSTPAIERKSALDINEDKKFQLIITDPPYYDQIPYSDTLDFFYMSIKAICSDLNSNFEQIFERPLAPKWDSDSGERELIDDKIRHGNDPKKSKKAYEDGMAEVFSKLHSALEDDGRLVVVFAHKNPVAWETLVSALIIAGFQTTAAWPIRTESATKVSASVRAFLSTSVWLVLKKRDPMADYAFDREVFENIEENIKEKLRRFWDAGIHGPDFLWAALGPGLEVFSQYEVVRKFKSSNGDELVTVGEFLEKVRDIVLRFSTGRLLTDYGSSDEEAEQIDNMTRYYLLHRKWYAHEDVDAGEVSKFAVACGFTDSQLSGRIEILSSLRGKKRRLAVADETAAADAQADTDKRGGSKYRLNRWNERTPPKSGSAFANEDTPPSLIDHVHRLLYLRLEGDKQAMDGHIKHWALGGHPVMPALVQALQEICKEENGKSSEELSLLESLSKDLDRLAGIKPAKKPTLMDWMNEEDD